MTEVSWRVPGTKFRNSGISLQSRKMWSQSSWKKSQLNSEFSAWVLCWVPALKQLSLPSNWWGHKHIILLEYESALPFIWSMCSPTLDCHSPDISSCCSSAYDCHQMTGNWENSSAGRPDLLFQGAQVGARSACREISWTWWQSLAVLVVSTQLVVEPQFSCWV